MLYGLEDESILVEVHRQLSESLLRKSLSIDYLRSLIELSLVGYLRTYKLRSAVSIDVIHDKFSLLSLPSDPRAISPSPRPPPAQPVTRLLSTQDPRSGIFGERILCQGSVSSEDRVSREYRVWRQLLGVAEGPELVDHIPLEANLDLLGYVSFTKGCYIGQELTARTKFKVSSLAPCHMM